MSKIKILSSSSRLALALVVLLRMTLAWWTSSDMDNLAVLADV